MSEAVVFYDGDCGFCRWCCERLRRWDRRRALGFEPIYSREGDRVLSHLDPAIRASSFHLWDGSRLTSGGEAVAEVLRRLRGGAALAFIASASPGASEKAYRLAARHRRGLARLVGERACAVDPSRPR